MITSISMQSVRRQDLSMQKNNPMAKTPVLSENNFSFSPSASNALKSNMINMAKSIQFAGALKGAFEELNQIVETCRTKDKKGEVVGSRANVNKLIHDYADDFAQVEDAIKTNIMVSEDKKEEDGKDKIYRTYARTQLKLVDKNDEEDSRKILFEMAVKPPAEDDGGLKKSDNDLKQLVQIALTPINYKGEGIREQAYVLNTKGNLVAVVEDGDNVLLTNAGKFVKKDTSNGELEVYAKDSNKPYKSFATPEIPPIQKRTPMPSIGEGTEIVIGLEDGRFVNEIMKSIQDFVDKVNKEEIVLQQFVANPNAQKTQLVMLAGGFGSRAEYTNASSSAILHKKIDGTQSTKGVFRTATGLTPMETTLITAHNAGLIDCSKDALEIGKNIKFYLNKTGKNTGNGGYTIDLYNKMEREGRQSITIFPNDSMSRMTEALKATKEKMDSGKAAIVMIAKKVEADVARGNFGIMKLSDENEILEFAEKPKEIPDGYADSKNMCLTNTFQFSVSKEAFKALSIVEPYLPPVEWGKESRDWSKVLVPVLMNITQKDNTKEMQEGILKSMREVKEFGKKEKAGENIPIIPEKALAEAKEALKGQKIYAVPTDEYWADCGTLNQLYHTTMEIASGKVKVEDFERAHVLSCVDTQTGLVASSPEQKKKILNDYFIEGQVMVVPQAEKITYDDVKHIPVIINK